MPATWAPYRNGQWSWNDSYGWTWVDYSPWGFAPFHYGRWNYFGDRWGWCPGPIYAPPYYGPAFVGFLGGGFGVGVGFGYGWGGGLGTLWENDPSEDMITILMTQTGQASDTPSGIFVDFPGLAYAAIDD